MPVKANLVVGQSGGPTSVINSSLAGVIAEARKSRGVGRIFGMRFAIQGFMQGELADLSRLSPARLKALRKTPSSALGSSRLKLSEDHFPAILEALKKNDIRYFHLIGGNDSMDTINRVVEYCRGRGYDLHGVGVPKTVDNDLFGTDHTPGFPSAARYTALSVLQGGTLARDMRRVDQFVIAQSIGRDAGWLTAASVMGRRSPSDPPHLLVLPERPLNRDRFLSRVAETHSRHGFVSIVCGEGAIWDDKTPISASETRDRFGNLEFGAMGGASAALALHRLIASHFKGWRGEFQITESLPMCAADRAVELDRKEAFLLGRAAVKLALSGKSGLMTCLVRTRNKPYKAAIDSVSLSDVAVRAKPMPDDMISEDGFDVTKKYVEYLKPLIGKMPEYFKL